MAARKGSAQWNGDLKGGDGTLTVGESAWTGAYTFMSRFEEGEGTNPEELIAAAHASCFSMFLANVLDQAGNRAEFVRTTASVSLGRDDSGPLIRSIVLDAEASVADIDEETFQAHAQTAKAGCPISRALAAVPEITLNARLV